ncbi:MAG TPA: NPCBM/NEW2 domain-containing protein [Jatrophihabitans sp.]|nr:NPCBM/NEW2 domain-containing protein [Jatrophihabitans sp.]
MKLRALIAIAALTVGSLAAVVTPPTAVAAAPPVAATPPMGWNDWYTFFCNIDEQLVEQTADAIVSSGMRDAGYDYVNLDDCWADHNRDANGNLQADPVKFPHGIKAVADYVHARGLKLGIYEDVGTKTCAGYPGSYGHVQQDADTFASWGVDFVKVDWCNVPFGDFPRLTQQQVAIKLYTEYSQALQATGRPMVFSICEWNPALEPWKWAPAISNMWRTNGDYGDSWNQILANVDREAPLADFAGPGHWNDPDILQVGLGRTSTDEDRAHFSAWAMLAAPLLAGNDLRSMSAATKAILTNRDVIAIDQDSLGAQATRVSHSASADVFTRRLANGDRAVLLLNRGNSPETITTTAKAAGLPNAGAYAVRDLWSHTTTESAGRIVASVPAHSAALYRVAPLSGEVDQYAPLTDVSVDPQVPAVYPGSTFHIARPGQTITAAATLRNDGRASISDARLALDVPQGWQLQGGAAKKPSLPSDATLTGSWQVTIPADAQPDTYTLDGAATYEWSDGTRSGEARGSGGFQVLVAPTGTVDVAHIDWLAATNGYGPVLIDHSYWGTPLAIHGVTYPHGLWTNAVASLTYYLGANCTQFTTDLGLDDSTKGTGTVDYTISVDGQQAFDSGVVTNSTPTVHANVDVSGAQLLQIDVGDAGNGISFDNADIAAPQLTCGA